MSDSHLSDLYNLESCTLEERTQLFWCVSQAYNLSNSKITNSRHGICVGEAIEALLCASSVNPARPVYNQSVVLLNKIIEGVHDESSNQA